MMPTLSIKNSYLEIILNDPHILSKMEKLNKKNLGGKYFNHFFQYAGLNLYQLHSQMTSHKTEIHNTNFVSVRTHDGRPGLFKAHIS